MGKRKQGQAVGLVAAAMVTALCLAACGGKVFVEPSGGSDGLPSVSSSSSSSSSSSVGMGGAGGVLGTSSSSASGAGGMSGASSSTGAAICTWSAVDPCGPGMYCDAPGCGAGTCVPKGAADGGARALACGCDGHTYWNPTVAARHGMATAAVGICPGSKCGGYAGTKCPPGLFCDYEFPIALCFISDPAGICTVLPDVCSPIVKSAKYCNTNQCTDECLAAKSDTNYYLDASCPP